MYMHLGLFTPILPTGWQARLTAGDATSLSGNALIKEFCSVAGTLQRATTESGALLVEKIL